MAINPQKLLPSSGGELSYLAVPKKISLPTAKIVASKPNIKGFLGVVNITTENTEENETLGIEDDVKAIRENTEKIKEVLKKSIAINLRKIQLQKRREENQKRQETESGREKKKEKDKGEFGINLPGPIQNAKDRMKNFIASVFLGWLAVRLIDHLPTFIKILDVIKPIASFIGNFISGLFDKLVSFIDVGYTVVDKIETTIDNIFGDEGVRKFKDFQATFTKFMNLAIIAAMLGTGGTDFGLNKGKFSGPQRVGFDRSGRRVGTRAQQRYRQRFGDKKFAQRFGNKNVRRLDKLTGKLPRGAADPLAGMVQKGVTKVAGKTAGRIAGKIPIVGPLIDFGIRAFVFKEPIGKAAAAAVGAGVGQALGAFLGGAVGGIVGSVVPFVGNLLVGSAGATIGGLIGGIIGDQIGASLYNVIAGKEGSAAAENLEKKESGGTIGEEDRKKQESQAAIEAARRARILQFMPSSDESHLQEQKDKEKPKKGNLFQQLWGRITGAVSGIDPFAAVRGAVKALRKKNNTLISKIMSLGIDLVAGKKPDSKAIKEIARNLVTFFDVALPAPAMVMRALLQKLANGGLITETPMERMRRIRDITSRVERSFASSVTKESKDALDYLNKTGGPVSGGGAPPGSPAAPGAPAAPAAPGSVPATPAGQTAAGTASLKGLSGTTGSAYAPQGKGAKVSISYSPIAKGSSATITSGFGTRFGRSHKGIDVSGPEGTPLYAYLDGEVTHVNTSDSHGAGYGYWIVWKDSVHGAYHFFGHMQRPPGLRPGAKFKAGALLGLMGNTGRSTGPHLHWEISNSAPAANGQFSNYLDPIQWVNTHGATKKPAQVKPPTKTPPAQQVSSKTSYEENKSLVAVIVKEVPGPSGSISRGGRSTPSPASIQNQVLAATA